jgi:hypothetical protein
MASQSVRVCPDMWKVLILSEVAYPKPIHVNPTAADMARFVILIEHHPATVLMDLLGILIKLAQVLSSSEL